MAFWPFRAVSWSASGLYILFLALNGLLVLAMPLVWDLYIPEVPRYMGAFRETWFYQETEIFSMPVVFSTLVFFNLVLANSFTTTVIGKGSWGLYMPVSYMPISWSEFRIMFRGASYYLAVFSLDWMVHDAPFKAALQQVAAVASGVMGLLA
ncbi:hypothetical protein [Pseudovibrio sp. SPO723]|uniref:hypothetical protein n=1 Tax=Nesiotobacter zosterae TaxID=392721 RepID=UPI0029C284A5|nr:hypothetical protein [Pseudovibrio sp. SPO723]MDX5592619.1 hypothetical protein [Pseudovibrio sp. SPO723]